MTPLRDRRPEEERGPVDWGDGPRASAHAGNSRSAGATRQAAPDVDWGSPISPEDAPRSRSTGTGPDWGVGRTPASGKPGATPWPQAVRRQRLVGIVFAMAGLALATWSAMHLATNAEAGHPWLPPWLVIVLGGAGLVSAAGYLAWAGGTAVRHEGERWEPTVLDAAAGLTTGTVDAVDPHHLLGGTAGADSALPPGQSSARRGPNAAAGVRVDSGPKPVMGTSTLDQSVHAPAGVAGAVGGFLLSAAVVCAVLALVLGTQWLWGTVALAVAGVLSIRLAGDWLGAI
ncbi:PsbA protein [Actinomyces sp. MRS3W]|uniref:PsbA protein n=1 Tax=Actinomyces sp. MRS3W TaxID=2800796 RepID=UPI0028FD1530|nr:PsbA protein [Actinomyces sp. MRS3W]MDU0349540.1 PsbA protein [Actinomyces sp. MRS3W]